MNIFTFIISAILTSSAFAQTSVDEEIRIPRGSQFEIQAHYDQGADVSWILSEDGDFVEASRDAIFRTRLTKEGSFTLIAQIDDGGKKIKRTFSLEVEAPDRNGDVGNSVFLFSPRKQNGSVSVNKRNQVVSVTPNGQNISLVAIDFDIDTDSSGDGNTKNDEDTKDTLFRNDLTTLHLWFVNGKPTTMRVGALFEDGETFFENIQVGEDEKNNVISEENANNRDVEEPEEVEEVKELEETTEDEKQDSRNTGSSNINVLKNDNGDVTLAVRTNLNAEEIPLLFYWDFGDGQTSLLDRPIHSYRKSGAYDISVDIRDIKTGRVIDTASETIRVNKLAEPTDQEPEENTNTTTGSSTEESKGGSGIIGLIIKIIIGFIISSSLGALVVWLVGKLKNSDFSLEKTMEKAEQTIVKPSDDTSADPAPMPMEVPAETVPEVVEAEEVPAPPVEESAPKAPEPEPPQFTPEPSSDAMQAPTETPESQIVESGPKPEPVPDAPPAAPSPETPQQPEAAESSTPEPPAAAPDWLQASATEPSTAVEEPVPNVSHTAMDPSAEQLEADTSNAPDWLQSGIQKAEDEGQTAATPVESTETPAQTEDTETKENDQLPANPLAQASNPEEEKKEVSDAERERKRKKRQRYRENVKKRKAEQKADQNNAEPQIASEPEEKPVENPDEPVAFITADEVPEAPEMPEPSAPPPPQTPESGDIPPAEEGQNPAQTV